MIARRHFEGDPRAAGLSAERGPGLSDPLPQRRPRCPAAKASASAWPPRSARALTGVLYVLDEPSIGLHQRDNDKLIATLKRLRDLGNTLIVVEHDEDTMRAGGLHRGHRPGRGRARRRGGGARHGGGHLQGRQRSITGAVSLRAEKESRCRNTAARATATCLDDHRRDAEQPAEYRRENPAGRNDLRHGRLRLGQIRRSSTKFCTKRLAADLNGARIKPGAHKDMRGPGICG